MFNSYKNWFFFRERRSFSRPTFVNGFSWRNGQFGYFSRGKVKLCTRMVNVCKWACSIHSASTWISASWNLQPEILRCWRVVLIVNASAKLFNPPFKNRFPFISPNKTMRIIPHLQLTDSFKPSKAVFNFNPSAMAATPSSRRRFVWADTILLNSIFRNAKWSRIRQCVGALVCYSLQALFPSL